ncbi:hypothetical protein BCAH1134_C0176 (plasmid) [Bacillus cereus AH1134]|nr:hypothetical protein BCAH1134_C0176 [Bacillus cereus AH1134]
MFISNDDILQLPFNNFFHIISYLVTRIGLKKKEDIKYSYLLFLS